MSYELIDPPIGLRINPISGYLNWLPSQSQIGDQQITIKVTDLGGLSSSKQLNLRIDENQQNLSPFIISAPIQSASANENYNYPVQGFDADGDVLAYQLLQAPIAMTINHATGEINWQPQTSDIGIHQITLEVRDSQGAKDTQNYILLVGSFNNPNNQSPSISSTPLVVASQLHPYTYQIIADDADGDALIYAKVAGPAEISVDASTGLLHWIPINSGDETLSISVSDGMNTIVQQWNLQIHPDTTINNTAPFISSGPVQNAQTNSNYQYQVIAIDPDTDPINYQLSTSPNGMSISATGLINYQPAQVGNQSVIIQISDDHGHTASQSYELNVIDPDNSNQNYSPIITSTPSYVIQNTDIYNYQIIATDNDGDNLSYTKITGPDGLIVDTNSQSLTWQTQQTGDYPVSIEVSDGQNSVRQNWVIRVIASNLGLQSQLILTPNAGIPGQQIEVFVIPQGGIGETTVTATIDNTPLTIDENNHASTIINELGTHRIVATISDDLDTIQIEKSVIISQTLDLFAPSIDIHSPDDAGIATGFVDINISVNDANLSEWMLSYRGTTDDTSRTELASGTTNIDQQIVTSLDTSLLRNGGYVLILEAIDIFGQANNVTHSIFIEGDLKIGHFQIAFEDLNIGVAGIPVTISRSYDTRDRNSDRAFGKGWSIGYQSLELTESRIPGLGWFKQTEFYNIGPVRLPRYCIYPIGERLVTIRLPDGTLEKFKVMAKTLNPTSDQRSDCQDLVPPDLFGIQFKSQGDTNSTLTANDIGGGLRVTNGNLQTLIGIEPINPNKYTLTLLDGTKYQIDQGFNLTEINTTDGNSITFTHNGIQHSNGFALEFIRDTDDRITAIVKPNGEQVKYTYDDQGNLKSHTDLMGNTTTFTYILDHFLEDIIDPRGIMVARNEYDADGRLIAHIDAKGKRIEYTHDIAGKVEIIKDRNGNSSLFVYDNAGNVIAETNAMSETILHEYNNIYLETKRTDALGNQTSWSYDQQGNQLTETDPDGNITTSSYNIKGEILSQIDPAGIVVINNQYSPDDNPFLGGGNLTKVSDALGHFTEFHWTVGQDADLNTVVVNTGFTNTNGKRHITSTISEGVNSGLTGSTIDVKGLKIESTYDDEAKPLTKKQIITDSNGDIIAEYMTIFEYNANGDTIKITDAKGNFIQREYNSINKISAVIDANGNRTEFEFDNLGNQIKTTYPDNTTELSKYNAIGNEIESIDRAGRVTKNIYDSADRVIEIIYPDATPNNDLDNPREINSYDQAGRLISVKDTNNNVTSYVYDSKNRRIKIIDSLNNEINIVYDYLDRETQRTDALGRVTKFEYDVLSRLTKTIFPDNTPNDNDNLFISKSYDNEGFQLSETNYAGLTKQYEYNNAGYLLSVTDSLLQKTEYTYDQRGNKLTQTDANGHTTTWVYDELSQISSRTLPDGKSEFFTYDAFGNMVSKTDFNGDITSYEYNNLNLQIKTIYADDTEVISTYTQTGQIASITQTHGTTTYGYDQRDRLTRIDYPTGNFIAYGYDLNGNRTQVRAASHTVDYTFDALNRIETVTDTSGITRYAYDAVGNKITQTNANATVATYSYNELDRLTDLVHTNADNTVIAGYHYLLDANGNRLSIIESTGRDVNYSYDNLDRLLSEEIIDLSNGNHLSEFSYDPVGNRLQKIKDGVETIYVYNNNDQLLSETANLQVTTYTYDNNGNTLTKSIDGTLNTSYSYSKDNQMIKAITPSEVIDYLYDLSGIRQMQNVGGNITQYLIDPNRDFAQVFQEQDDTTQTTYTYGDDLISEKIAADNYTYAYDGLGSTRILTDANAVVKNSYGYHAFGESSYQTGTVTNHYLYTGEQLDNNTDLYYLRSRYYNASIGRFNKMDTWSGSQLSPLTLNKYAYVLNNPANLVDPSGLFFGLGELLAAGQIRGIQSTTATTSYRVTLRKISKNLACVAVSELVEGVIVDTIIGGGIYLLQDNGQQYVGRSKDILKRLKQHMKNTKKQVERIMAVFHIGDLANQRVIEQFFIDILKTIKRNTDGANQINSVAPNPRSANSKRLRKLLKNLDFCKD